MFINAAAKNPLFAADVFHYLGTLQGQIAWAKVVGKEVRPRVAVTQDQVDLALKDALSGKADEQLALSEILLPVIPASAGGGGVR